MAPLHSRSRGSVVALQVSDPPADVARALASLIGMWARNPTKLEWRELPDAGSDRDGR